MLLILGYLVLTTGAVGVAYAANHKLPERLYQGRLASLLNCSLCTGTEVGLLFAMAALVAWWLAYGQLPLPWPLCLLGVIGFAPHVGLLSMLTQRWLNLITAIEERQK